MEVPALQTIAMVRTDAFVNTDLLDSIAKKVSKRVRYQAEHDSSNSISTSNRVLFCLLCRG